MLMANLAQVPSLVLKQDGSMTEFFRAKAIIENRLQQCINNYQNKFFYSDGRKKKGLLRLVAYFRNDCFGNVDYDETILFLYELSNCHDLSEIFSAVASVERSGNSNQLITVLYDSILRIMNINQWNEAYKKIEALQLQQWKSKHQSRETRAMKKQLIAAATKKQLCQIILSSNNPKKVLTELADKDSGSTPMLDGYN